LRPIRLVEEVDRKIPRDRAVQFLQLVAQAVVDNYAEFKDYHQTSPQSAYGENLFILLDFLQVKASYERHVWILRPLYLIHDVLIRASQHEAAVHWRERCAEHQRQPADEYVARLRSLEQTYGIRLATVADRIGERFVRPLDLDRLCGLVEPAMAEAGQPEHPAFDRFEGELAVFADQPSGVGLDTPPWLQRLALEVNRVRARQSSLVALAEHWLQVPRIRLTAEEFQKQIEAIQPATGEPEREEEAPS